MTQMIIDGIYLPMSSGDRFACWEEELSTTVGFGKEYTLVFCLFCFFQIKTRSF